jgi:protein PhnA
MLERLVAHSEHKCKLCSATEQLAECAVEPQEQVDSNGIPLLPGDSVTLIKNLNVKGAGFNARRETAVRNIGLVQYNTEHLEGRVRGQQIVILCHYVKKNK